MDRKILQQIYWLTQELEMWERKKTELKEKADAIGSPTNIEPTGVHGTRTSNRTEEIALALAEIDEIINGKLIEIQWARRDAFKLIDSLDDSLLRQIVMYRCVDLMSWEDVANSTGSSEYAVKQMFYRAFPRK